MSESGIKTVLQPQLHFCCEVERFQNQTLEEFSFEPSSMCVETCPGTHSMFLQDTGGIGKQAITGNVLFI